MATTKLLVSFPVNPSANKHFGKASKNYNKPGDSGVDLPSVMKYPLSSTVHGQTLLVDYGTVFAMYDTNYDGAIPSLLNLCAIFGLHGVSWLASEEDALRLLIRNMKPMGYMLAPRSSIVKTPFRLANSMGIIDVSYKGYTDDKADTIKAALDFVPALYDDFRHKPAGVAEGDRLVQIISPDLSPIYHHKLDSTIDAMNFWREYISSTARGGFGTTGKA